MKRSNERILTTHVGSLARPGPLLDLMREKEHGRPYDAAAFDREVQQAVADAVGRQVEAGIDVVNDGEQGKASFFTYIVERLTGFSATEGEPVSPPSWRREIEAFPEYYRSYFGKYTETVVPLRVMACTGPVAYQGHKAIEADIANLRDALVGHEFSEAFIPATSPSGFGRNAFYESDTDYHVAVAEALRSEYLAITEAGFVLQIDDPWLIELVTGGPDADPTECVWLANEHIEILNYALRGIPEDRIRLHTCYGLNAGPRIHDLPLAEIAPFMLRINAGAYSFEVANPRHQHEWRIWEDIPLPAGKILIPGFLGHANNYVEHPRLVADGIVAYAKLVGRDNIIAGADCGFSSRATYAPEVHPSVVWEKFKALGEGARLASAELWS